MARRKALLMIITGIDKRNNDFILIHPRKSEL